MPKKYARQRSRRRSAPNPKPSGSRTPLGTRRRTRRKGGKELSHIFPEDYERGPFPECKRQLHGSDQFFKRLFLLLPSRKPQKAGERLSGRRRRVHTKKPKVVKLVPISLTKGGCGGGWSDCGVRCGAVEGVVFLPPPPLYFPSCRLLACEIRGGEGEEEEESNEDLPKVRSGRRRGQNFGRRRRRIVVSHFVHVLETRIRNHKPQKKIPRRKSVRSSQDGKSAKVNLSLGLQHDAQAGDALAVLHSRPRPGLPGRGGAGAAAEAEGAEAGAGLDPEGHQEEEGGQEGGDIQGGLSLAAAARRSARGGRRLLAASPSSHGAAVLAAGLGCEDEGEEHAEERTQMERDFYCHCLPM